MPLASADCYWLMFLLFFFVSLFEGVFFLTVFMLQTFILITEGDVIRAHWLLNALCVYNYIWMENGILTVYCSADKWAGTTCKQTVVVLVIDLCIHVSLFADIIHVEWSDVTVHLQFLWMWIKLLWPLYVVDIIAETFWNNYWCRICNKVYKILHI